MHAGSLGATHGALGQPELWGGWEASSSNYSSTSSSIPENTGLKGEGSVSVLYPPPTPKLTMSVPPTGQQTRRLELAVHKWSSQSYGFSSSHVWM